VSAIAQNNDTPSTKPVRRLAQTTALLILFLAGATALIATIKYTRDRSLQVVVLDETTAHVRSMIERGKLSAADSRLEETVRAQPMLAKRLGWEFVDYCTVLPRFRALLLHEPPDDALLVADILMRTSGSPTLARETTPVEVAAAYALRTALWTSNYALLAKSGAESDLILPPQTLLLTYPEFIFDSPSASESPVHYGPEYRALLSGDVQEAQRALTATWNADPTNADAAFLLGVCAEATGSPVDAKTWYAHALGTGANHLGAANALLRLEGATE